MRPMLTAAAALLLVAGQVTAADDVKPVKPGLVAVKLSQLEEEYETLEAHRDVKKAYVKAAQITMSSAEKIYKRVMQGHAAGAIAAEELETAKLNVEIASAQVEIRVAELKEVEVKVKFAKKRLDEAKLSSDKRKPGAP